MAATVRKTATDNINLRISTDEKALIDRAAETLGKNRSEFMLDTMRSAAEDVLLDQRLFKLDDDAFAAFEAMLDAPVEPSPALRKTMATTPPWDARS